MNMERPIVEIGYHKGEMDFEVTGTVQDLSREEFDKLKLMALTALRIADDMWTRANVEQPKSNHETN